MNINVTGRLAHWSLFIQQFDFEIKHRPGVSNGNADVLSRHPYPSEHANVRSLTLDQPDHVREMQIPTLLISLNILNPKHCLMTRTTVVDFWLKLISIY